MSNIYIYNIFTLSDLLFTAFVDLRPLAQSIHIQYIFATVYAGPEADHVIFFLPARCCL